jgi:hypothetical protein
MYCTIRLIIATTTPHLAVAAPVHKSVSISAEGALIDIVESLDEIDQIILVPG